MKKPALPDKKELKNFGYTIAIAIVIIFGVLYPLFRHRPIIAWPWITCGILLAISTFIPIILKPFYHFWMMAAKVLEWINSRIILSIIFLFFITPIGIVARLSGHRALKLEYEKSLESYRIKSNPIQRERMEEIF